MSVTYECPRMPQVLRDDSALSQSALHGQPACTAPAAEFHLVWRQPGADGATLWEPVPPRGYRSLGACASSSATSPPAKAALCVREDATQPAGLYDSPLWRVDPPVLQVRRPALRLPAWACCLAPLCLLFFLPSQVWGWGLHVLYNCCKCIFNFEAFCTCNA